MDLITKQPGVFNAHVGAFVTGGTHSATTAKKATEKAEQGEEQEDEEEQEEEGVIFTYEVLSGPCHRSFGINVAACSGFPASVVSSARRALRNIKAAAAAAGVAGDRNWLKSDETAQGRGGKRKGKRNGKKKEKEKGEEERRSRKQRRTTPGQQSSEEEKALLSAAEEAKAFLDEMRTMREPLRGMEDAVAASVIGAFAAKARLVAERAGQGVLSLS